MTSKAAIFIERITEQITELKELGIFICDYRVIRSEREKELYENLLKTICVASANFNDIIKEIEEVEKEEETDLVKAMYNEFCNDYSDCKHCKYLSAPSCEIAFTLDYLKERGL